MRNAPKTPPELRKSQIVDITDQFKGQSIILTGVEEPADPTVKETEERLRNGEIAKIEELEK